ncbi:hypothetical protein IAQ61_007589 [Plenodomus lingam]|nr:hypothetical protein IAQ61_007589 [Plenodomus lingam]
MGTIRVKRSITEADTEVQLLEANKKRLLKRPDWIGVNPSKPVSLPLVPSRDKPGIGKRRRTEIKPGATVGHGMTTNLTDRLIQHDMLREGLRSGVRRNDRDHMRIRIGTDALTSAYSTQRHGCGESQDSSDPMLFEQEYAPNAGTGEPLDEPLKAVRPVNHWSNAASSTFQQEPAAPHGISLTDNHNHRHFEQVPNVVRSRFLGDPDQSDSQGEGFNTQVNHVYTIPRRIQSDASHAPRYRVTQRTGGAQQPFLAIFDDPDSSEDEDGHKGNGENPVRNSTREQLQMDEQLFANAARPQRIQRADGEGGCPNLKRSSAVRTIVDAKAWESFLAIASDDSSHSTATMESRSSNLHLYPTSPNNNKATATWSQLATQGSQAQIGTSAMSASLPSMRRGIGRRALIDATIPDRNRVDVLEREPSQNIEEDEDERLWQAFVFGSDDTCSSSRSLHVPGYRGALSNEPEAISCISLSAAVSSIPPTSSVISPSRVHSITENHFRPAGNVTPGSVRREERSSPVVQGGFDDLSDGELSRDFVQRRLRMGNNACCDTSLDPGRRDSGTRTVEGRLQQARSSAGRQASAGRLDGGQYYSSMQAGPGSDSSSDNNLHLVDAALEA